MKAVVGLLLASLIAGSLAVPASAVDPTNDNPVLGTAGVAMWETQAQSNCAGKSAYLTYQYIDPGGTAIINIYHSPGLGWGDLYFNYWLARSDNHDRHSLSVAVESDEGPMYSWARGEADQSVQKCLKITGKKYSLFGAIDVPERTPVSVDIEGISFTVAETKTVGFRHVEGEERIVERERGMKAEGIPPKWTYSEEISSEYSDWTEWITFNAISTEYKATVQVDTRDKFTPLYPTQGAESVLGVIPAKFV